MSPNGRHLHLSEHCFADCCVLLVSLQQLELSSEEHEHYGPLQQHHRVVASLNKQIQQKTKELGEVRRSLWFNECAVLNCVQHFILIFLHY